MLNGIFNEGKAVVRIKTDLNHPNPAVREWPALRIIDTDKFPHPRTGEKYRVWPLFAFCCGIDDHDLQISHIIRGKEHLTNTVRQRFLYNYLKWEYPNAIHYGRFKIVGGILSKSKIRDGIVKGLYNGWDDPRLGTLIALRKRGFLSNTIRRLIQETGPKPVDITISWKNMEAINRKLLDPIADRYFFIADPQKLRVNNVKEVYNSKLPLHPDDPTKGSRNLSIKPKEDLVHLLISKNDLKVFQLGKVIRLMSLFNVVVKRAKDDIEAAFHSVAYVQAKQIGAPLIHWLPHSTGVEATILMSDSSTIYGLAEDSCRMLNPGDIIQFERFGFVKVDKVSDEKIIAYYTHR